MLDQKKYTIPLGSTARDALKRLNDLGEPSGVLFVLDDKERVVGTLTDGDVRRGLLKDYDVDDPLDKYMHRNFLYFNDRTYTKERIKEVKAHKIRFAPYLDKNGRIQKIIPLSELRTILPLDVVIMAGGRGTRLRPLTDDVPKPLLKVGSKPILEHTIDRLYTFGINHVTIAVGYLGDKIKKYFGDGSDRGMTIRYVVEKKPLGTMGAVALVDKFFNNQLLVMNADLLTNFDIEEFFDTFVESDADMLVPTVPYSVNVPYAVMEIGDNQNVTALKEKPRYTYYANAGIYMMKKKLVKLIPRNTLFNATDMMQLVIKRKYTLVTEPILGYWLDIGRMEDYVKAQQDLKHLDL